MRRYPQGSEQQEYLHQRQLHMRKSTTSLEDWKSHHDLLCTQGTHTPNAKEQPVGCADACRTFSSDGGLAFHNPANLALELLTAVLHVHTIHVAICLQISRQQDARRKLRSINSLGSCNRGPTRTSLKMIV